MSFAQKILAATDFSNAAQRAVEHACALAAAYGGEVLVAHVLRTPLQPFGFDEAGAAVVEQQLDRGVQQHLARVVGTLRERGHPVRAVMRRGGVVERLLEIVREEQVDLVVMGTHAYTSMQHLLLGSVAERLLRMAPCPVLVVPPGAA